MAGGSVELSVSLSLAQLLKDAKQASETIKKQLKDPELKVRVSVEGGEAATKGIYAMAQAFEDAVRESSLYTQALSQVGGQLSQTGAQINQFSEQAAAAAIKLDTAKAALETLGVDSEVAADALQSLTNELKGQASGLELTTAAYDVFSSKTETLTKGLTDAEVATTILKAATIGAVGGFTDTATVSDALTSSLNAYGESANQAQVYTDKMTATVAAGKIKVAQYAGQIGKLAPTAGLAGVGIDELNGFIATATVKGVPVERTFAGINQAIASGLKPTAEATALAEKLGISFDATALRTKGLKGILGELNARGLDTPDILLKLFGSVEAVSALAPAAGAGFKILETNIAASANSAGLAQKAFDTVADSSQGKLTTALNQANDALVKLGNGVKAAIVPLAEALTFLLENFNALPEPIQGAIGVAIALTGGALTLAGALAAIAAVLPSVVAGLKVMGIQGAAAGTGAAAAGAGATAGAGGMGAMATAAGGLLVKLGLITIAMSVVQTALSRFEDGGASFKEAAAKIEKSMLDLQLESGKTKDAIESILPKEPPPTDFIDGVVAKFNELNSAINEKLGLPPDFLAVPSDSLKKLEDARVGVSELQQSFGRLVDSSRAFFGSQEDAAKIQANLTAAIAASNSELSNLNPAKLGTVAYEELSTKINATITELEGERTALEKRTGLATESANASVAAGDAIAGAEGKAADAIARTTEAYTQSTAQLGASSRLREAEIKTSMASGLTTEADGQAQLLEQQRSSGQQRLALAENQAELLRDLLSSTADPEKAKELNGKIVEADGAVADARLEIAENLASAREALEKKALDAIEKANREAEAAIASSQNGRIIFIKQAQLEGTKSAEEASAAIAQIEQEGIAQTIALRRDELDQVRKLREQGMLSAEEAATREIELNQEVGRLNIQRIDAEIEAQKRADEERKKAALDAIDQSFAPAQAKRQDISSNLELQTGAISQQNSLLQAQQNLQTALAGAENARYDRAIAAADKAGDSVKAEQLKLEQIQKQGTFLEQQFQIQLQQLALQQQQRSIELERQQIAAEIAKVEAEIAIQKAIANSATDAEIANLQRVLTLQEKRLEQAGKAIEQQRQINALESQTLNTTQGSQRQQQSGAVSDQRGAIADARNPRGNATAAGGATGSSEGRILTSRGVQTLSAEDSEKQRIEQGRRYGFNASGTIAQLNSKVPASQISSGVGISDLGQTIQTGDAAVVVKLDELKAAVVLLANTPRSVTVSAPDPVAAVGKVLSDIGRASLKRAKL